MDADGKDELVRLVTLLDRDLAQCLGSQASVTADLWNVAESLDELIDRTRRVEDGLHNCVRQASEGTAEIARLAACCRHLRRLIATIPPDSPPTIEPDD
jgi:hypothetical protein